ncbi:trehalose 6-phosphate phosphatase [Catalinimonas alkaloidigena]|uniref:Trehalose 6-phosphate phosphatase n=1 Tax=Catalinimonas alkaloidigena TaxID=1075417 RepID=A0A1G9UM44_9BACT|nr:trehalose-phosphatase [Catalinimonas alkaloidigena]SDM60968.1 trehalose 6-phosphate phosphatase [Catalinimonas alkaloidigena]
MPQLPSALDHFDEIKAQFGNRQIALFLDYDGTLTPIVPDPEKALLSETMRRLLDRIASQRMLIIVSGRDRANVADKVDLPELIYVGSHGFDIKGPELEEQHHAGIDALPALDAAEQELRDALADVPGAQVERKKYAIAVHYRQVAPEQQERVKQEAEQAAQRHETLKPAGGKGIVELKPNYDWHKGKSIRWLVDTLELSPEEMLPVYLGDDLTDEDAFREMRDWGITVLVGDHGHETAAQYGLHDVDEVGRFLQLVLEEVEQTATSHS